jgi:hypothetical protein
MGISIFAKSRPETEIVRVSEGACALLKEAFDYFGQETGISISQEATTEIDAEYLLELFLALQGMADQLQTSSVKIDQGSDFADELDLNLLGETRRQELLHVLGALMSGANDAFNAGDTLLFYGDQADEPENDI